MGQTTGARALAEMLEGYGVTHNFMVPAVLRRTLAEMERHTGIVSVHTHGEKPAAYMADGYARASGRPGLCMAQQVGTLNLAAGLRDAWLAHAPVIAFTGGRRSEHRYRRLYQDAEDFPALEPYTKFNGTIDDVERIPDMVRQAFRTATTGCPGPVHLQFRGQEGELDREEGTFDTTVETQFACVPAFRPTPDGEAVRRAVEMIGGAARPVIVAGGGARASAAGEALSAFAEAAGVPVATSLNGRQTFPENHPLAVGVVGTYSRPVANQIVDKADLVVFLGTEAGSMTTNFWRLPRPGTATIQIDVNPEAIGRNYPADVALLGDADLTLRAMSALQPTPGEGRGAWLAGVEALRDAWAGERAAACASDAEPVRPERLCADLSKHLPEDAIVVVDTGHAGMWMASMFDLTSPRQGYLRSAGHLGWAFPAGLGAKCACPDRPVVTFTGDLGLWYHIAEIETAVRWGINAVTVVNNNHSGNQSRRGFALAYDGEPTERSRELWVHREVNFAAIAEEIGALGIRVTRPGDFAPALARALEAGRPAIVDVVTDIEAAAPLAWDADDWTQRY